MSGVYSPKYNINFFCLPKCACTLTRQLWYHLHGDEMIKEVPTCEWHLIWDDFLPPKMGVPSYVAVRNPYYRTVSMYTNRFCGEYEDSITSRHHFRQLMGPVPFTFLNFCRYLQLGVSINWEGFNWHFLPQTNYFSSLEKENLHLIYCQESDAVTDETPNQNMCRQYKQVYRKLLDHSEFDAPIDAFFAASHTQNITPLLEEVDSDIDYTTFEMIAAKSFPPHIYFLTPETKSILADVYAVDFANFDYPV